MTLNEKVKILEQEIVELKSKMTDLLKNLESKNPTPYSKVGTGRDNSQNKPVEPGTGLGNTYGGNLPWNDSELKVPSYGTQPAIPTKGYNKHGHSRYSGGAMDINTLELVEYETDENNNILDEEGNILNKHSQQFWHNDGKIKTVEQADGEGNTEFVPKIGNLDIEFDASTRKWVAGSKYIDVEETYLVRRDESGEFMLDENETEMKSSLYNEDPLKSCLLYTSPSPRD